MARPTRIGDAFENAREMLDMQQNALPIRMKRGPRLEKSFTREEDRNILTFISLPENMSHQRGRKFFETLHGRHFTDSNYTVNDIQNRAKQLVRPCHEVYAWSLVTGLEDSLTVDHNSEFYPTFQIVMLALRHYCLGLHENSWPVLPHPQARNVQPDYIVIDGE